MSAPEGVYADWLPAPGEFDDGDRYHFYYTNVGDLHANRDYLGENSFDPSDLEDAWAPLAFGVEDTSHYVGSRHGGVIEAAFDRDDAISTLRAERYEEDSEYDGYTLMARPSGGGGVFTVGDGVLVITATVDAAETILDAKSGDGARYGEASDDMATLVGALGTATTVGGRTVATPDRPDPESGQFENMVARGGTTKISGETSEDRQVVVYERSDDVDTSDLEQWVDANSARGQRFDGVRDVSYSSDGRLGVITGTMDTDAF